MQPNSRPSLSPAAELAAYAGIVPLVVCPIAVALLPGYEQRELAQRIALTYGAVVLAFVGAVHWGLALAGHIHWSHTRLAGSLLPALCAVVAIVLGGERGLALLVVGLGLFWLYEHRHSATELPDPYLRVRRNLSLAGGLLLAVTMILSDYVGLT